MFAALSTGASGLRAHQTAIETTARNIANAGREGYHREEVRLSNGPSIQRGNLAMGTGVRVDAIVRVGNPMLERRIGEATGEVASSRAFAEGLRGVDDALAGQGDAFAGSLDAFRKSTQDVAASPDSLAAREAMVAAAQDLAGKFNALSETLGKHAGMQGGNLETDVADANEMGKMLAGLNKDAAHLGKPSASHTNDSVLLAREIAEKVGGSYEVLDNGMVNFTLPNGSPLVVADKSFEATVEDVAGYEGVVQGQSSAQAKIAEFKGFFDSMMSEFASSMNATNQAGETLNGDAGGALFSIGADGKMQVVATPEGIAAGQGAGRLDNRNAFELANQIDARTTQGGTETLSASFSQFMAQVGGAVRNANSDLSSAEAGLASLEKYEQDAYGVNLEQEMVKMMHYQRVYEANAKVIQTADSMLGTLINMKA